jgi:hypothetical protein
MVRLWAVLFAVGLIAGCGGGAEKNKFKDLDRPRPAEKG